MQPQVNIGVMAEWGLEGLPAESHKDGMDVHFMQKMTQFMKYHHFAHRFKLPQQVVDAWDSIGLF